MSEALPLSRRACLAAPALMLLRCGAPPVVQSPAGQTDALVDAYQARRPAGPWAVGLAPARIGDREAWIWRPVESAGEPRPLPVPDEYGARLRRRFGPEVGMALVRARGHAGADGHPSPERFPILLFQPGATFGARDYRLFIEGIASEGHIVVGVNPVGSPRASAERLTAAAADFRAVLDDLGALGVGDPADLRDVILAGHSIGGAAAVLALDHPSAGRAINLDGDHMGAAPRATPDKPILYLLSDNPAEPASARTRRSGVWGKLAAGWPRASALLVPGMDHLDVTDGALLSALAVVKGARPRRGDPLRTHPVVMQTVADWLRSDRPDARWRESVVGADLRPAFAG